MTARAHALTSCPNVVSGIGMCRYSSYWFQTSCEDERSQLYKITSCEHGSLLLKSILARAASALVTAREIVWSYDTANRVRFYGRHWDDN